MVDHSDIRRAREIADEIGLGGQEGGQIFEAVYRNDGLIDSLGSREVENLKTGLRHLDHYLTRLSNQSNKEINDPGFLVSGEALLDDIGDWQATRTRAEPASERLMERIADYIRLTEASRTTESADPLPLQHLASQFSDGGELSSETREINGDFQQRLVLKSTWQSVPKPSGLS